MSGDQVDGRRPRPPAAPATQALDEVFKGHVALALDQQAHRVANRTAAALQLNEGLPLRQVTDRLELEGYRIRAEHLRVRKVSREAWLAF